MLGDRLVVDADRTGERNVERGEVALHHRADEAPDLLCRARGARHRAALAQHGHDIGNLLDLGELVG